MNKFITFLPSALDHEAVEVCDLLGQDLLEAFGQSSSSDEEQDSSVKGTSYTSSWKPGTRLSAIQ